MLGIGTAARGQLPFRPCRSCSREIICLTDGLIGFGQNTGGFGQPPQQNMTGGLFGGGGTSPNAGFGEHR